MKSSSKLRALRYFSILAFQLFSISPLAAILDTNTNGMSDIWEKQYNNGELFPSSFLPAADPDLDGWDNLTEAAAGTDPHNANSPNGHIRVSLQPTSAPGLFHLTHPTILGKNYQLQGSFDLAQWYNISDAHLALENQHTTITGASLTDGAAAPRYFWRTLITDADTDNDGLSNAEEHTLNTNPYHNDTDNDGILDKNELIRNLNPLHYDTDLDRLPDAAEDTLTTNPADPDTDGDTLKDGEEVNQGTNPLLADTDADGLTDAQEKTHRTNPLLADTDGDTRTDSYEIANGTNPLRADTDFDGIPDGTDPSPLVNEIQNDPDGYNLPAPLNTVASGQLRARWDFHHLNTTAGLGLFKPHPSITSLNNLGNVGNILTSNTTSTDAVITSSGIQTRYPTGMPHACAHLLQNNSYLKLPNGNYPVSNGANWSFWIQFQKNILHSDPSPRTLIAFGTNAASPRTTMVLHAYIRPPTALEIKNNQDFANKLVVAHNSGAANTVTFPLPDDLDDGQWHHLSLAYGFQNNVNDYYLTIDGGPRATRTGNNINQASLTGISGILPYIMIGKFHHNISSLDPAITKPLAAKIDRLRIYGRRLTTAENLALYNHNLDNDSLPDRIENTTAYWRDTTPDNLSDGSEIFYTRSPYQWEPADADSDGDGIDDATEIILGTHPGKADTDGDLMPDGWEHQNQLDPLSPADANYDPDNDGLTNINEYRYTTKPRVADTDTDGKQDGPEAKGPDGNLDTDDGSNPADGSDEGNRPPADQLITLTLGVGDRSGSKSEDYVLNVFQLQPDGSEKRIYTLRSGGFGQYKEETKAFPRKHSYSFQIDWQGTNNQGTSASADSDGADFDYHLVVDPQSGHESHTLIDAYDPREKTVDTENKLRDPEDINPADDGDDDVTEFLTTHEPKRVVLLRAGILVDANRDGEFSQADEGKITEEKPWRIWVNDDDDSGETGGKDIAPGTGTGLQANFYTGYVNGIRDLVDFFPVTLQIKEALRILPTAKYDYILKMTDGPILAPLAVAWLEDVDLENNYGVCDDYQKLIEKAREAATKKTHHILRAGVPLPSSLTDQLHNGNGMMILEGRIATSNASLTLLIKNKETGATVAESKLPVAISKVEDMYRTVNLLNASTHYDGSTYSPDTEVATQTSTPTAYPDTETNGKYFVFLHGFNVPSKASKGWHAEAFKRLHQLGSRARFVGVSWRGSGGFNDYHGAVFRAQQTGDALGAALGFTQGADVTIAAHSLGNAVVSQAISFSNFTPDRYYMINGAVAREAFTLNGISAIEKENMVEKLWKPYTAFGQERLLAANWHQLFANTPSDARNKLTWKLRFENTLNKLQNKAYNFYSPGDEVVQNPTVQDANVGREMWAAVLGKGGFVRGAWVAQEYAKGGTSLAALALSRTQAGWSFNLDRMEMNSEGSPVPVKPIFATQTFISNDSLIERPFFSPFNESNLHNVYYGNAKAAETKVQYDLLASGLPALSYAMAVNPMPEMAENINMETLMTDSSQWPTENHSGLSAGRWLHSDMREVALCHLYKMYEKMITLGNLDQ